MNRPMEQEREAFEAWRLEKFCGGQERLKKCSNAPDVYYYTAERESWKAWQASRAALCRQVEPAPEQDEREASRSVEPIVRALNASVAVGSDGDWVSIRREHRDAAVRMLSDLDADFRHVYHAYAEAQKRANRPAQTEQQPVAWRDEVGTLYPSRGSVAKYMPEGRIATPLYAAPIAQTATQPERDGLVAALEQFADDSNWCYDTCNISRDVAKDALASYRSTQGGDA